MTTVDEARAALIDAITHGNAGPQHVIAFEAAVRAESESAEARLLDEALSTLRAESAETLREAAATVRAETLHNLGPFGPEQRYLDGLAQGRHESAETLRALYRAHVEEAETIHERKTGVKVKHGCSDCMRFDRALAATPADPDTNVWAYLDGPASRDVHEHKAPVVITSVPGIRIVAVSVDKAGNVRWETAALAATPAEDEEGRT